MTADDRKARDAATRVIALCEVIAQIVARGEQHFLDDIQTQWAAEMGLIRIGEAVAKIPASVRERFDGQPWRQIIDMRTFVSGGTTTSTRVACGAPSRAMFHACANICPT